MRKEQIFVVAVMGMLAGCVSFPQSPAEFRSKAAAKREFTANLALQEAYELVARNTIRCHQGDTNQMSMVGGSFFVFPTGSTRVEGKIDQPRATATITVNYLNPTGSGLLQVIDFARIDPTRTSVAIYRMNDSKKWITATQSVEDWFSNSRECYDQW